MEISRDLLSRATLPANEPTIQSNTGARPEFRDALDRANDQTMPASERNVKMMTVANNTSAGTDNDTTAVLQLKMSERIQQRTAGMFRGTATNATAIHNAPKKSADHAAPSTYTIRPGDTLTSIAQKLLQSHGQDAGLQASSRMAYQLARSNGITNPNRIMPGQQLDASVVKNMAPTVAIASIYQAPVNQATINQASINNTYSNSVSTKTMVPVTTVSATELAAEATNDESPTVVNTQITLSTSSTPNTSNTSNTSNTPITSTYGAGSPRSKLAEAHPVLERTLERAVQLKYVRASEKTAVREKILQLSKEHGFSPDDLAVVMLMESDGMNPRATNGRCHGLIQFCDGLNRGAATVGFGKNPKAITKLGVLEQLDLVGRYFNETGLRNFDRPSLDTLYLTVLTPSARRESDPNTNLDIQGRQAIALYEGNNRTAHITRNSLLTGLYENARKKLAAPVFTSPNPAATAPTAPMKNGALERNPQVNIATSSKFAPYQ